MNKSMERIKNGIITENPTFVQILGMCPTLAVTTSAMNGLGMGLSTTVILIMSNLMISALRNVIPNRVRIPAYIVIVASFVTIIDFLLQAYIPSLSESLGGYIKLIVVNCIILGRAEAYASKNPVIPSVFDGVGMGLGFTVGLTTIGLVRELIGAGSVFGFEIPGYQPIGIFVLSPGAFLVLAFLIAFLNYRKSKKKSVEANDTVCRMEDCIHCGNTSCGGKFFDFDGETDVVGRVGQNVKESVKKATVEKKVTVPKKAEAKTQATESKMTEAKTQVAESKKVELENKVTESKKVKPQKQDVESKQSDQNIKRTETKATDDKESADGNDKKPVTNQKMQDKKQPVNSGKQSSDIQKEKNNQSPVDEKTATSAKKSEEEKQTENGEVKQVEERETEVKSTEKTQSAKTQNAKPQSNGKKRSKGKKKGTGGKR